MVKRWIVYWESFNGDQELLKKDINKKIVRLLSRRKSSNQVIEIMIDIFSSNLPLEQQLNISDYKDGKNNTDSYFSLNMIPDRSSAKISKTKNSIIISIGGQPLLIAEKAENISINRNNCDANTEIIEWQFQNVCHKVNHPLKE